VVNSIRFRLLFWYALILLLLACALGVLLYVNVRRSIYAEIDGQLRAHALALAANLRAQPDGTFDLDLTEEHVQFFQQERPGAPYYAIWNKEGEVVDQTNPEITGHPREASRSGLREVGAVGPNGSRVLVGQDISGVQRRLREILWITAILGAGAMGVALAGGWFLADRALRPIERITRTARTVSASNLSQRIDLTRVEGELNDLARTLNDAFDRLQQSFEQQTRFTADASHELRTPLSIVLSHAELALKKPRSEADYRAALETTLKAARRMKSVVEALLTLARADAREVTLRLEPVKLHELVADAVSGLTPVAAGRQVTIDTDLGPVEMSGDRNLLHELVTNLLKNAILYNRDGGRVTVTLTATTDAATLTVADTGIGIPAADQPHVFRRFYRVDKARSREQGGTGLGLAISQWITHLHRGTISFTSEEGVGTTFAVTLPTVPSEVPRAHGP
jgi:heavy metal sensor kinase